jgi:hypothetical protein
MVAHRDPDILDAERNDHLGWGLVPHIGKLTLRFYHSGMSHTELRAVIKAAIESVSPWMERSRPCRVTLSEGRGTHVIQFELSNKNTCGGTSFELYPDKFHAFSVHLRSIVSAVCEQLPREVGIKYEYGHKTIGLRARGQKG